MQLEIPQEPYGDEEIEDWDEAVFTRVPQRQRTVLTIPQQLRQVMLELEMISHVPAARMDSSAGRDAGEDVGGKRPTGGVDRKDDGDRDGLYKSVEHFKYRLSRARTERDLTLILADAERSLRSFARVQDWHRGQVEPERMTLRWKRMIANLEGTAEVIAHRYEIGKRTVYRYREEYREEAA